MPASSRAGARTEVTLLSSDIIASATDFTNSGTSALVRYAPCSDSLVIAALKDKHFAKTAAFCAALKDGDWSRISTWRCYQAAQAQPAGGEPCIIARSTINLV